MIYFPFLDDSGVEDSGTSVIWTSLSSIASPLAVTRETDSSGMCILECQPAWACAPLAPETLCFYLIGRRVRPVPAGLRELRLLAAWIVWIFLLFAHWLFSMCLVEPQLSAASRLWDSGRDFPVSAACGLCMWLLPSSDGWTIPLPGGPTASAELYGELFRRLGWTIV